MTGSGTGARRWRWPGLAVTQGTATPGLAAELHAMEGRGFAVADDTRGAHRAVLAAQRAYESMCPDGGPPWQGIYTEAAFSAHLGMCLRDLGEAERASKLTTAALDGCAPRNASSGPCAPAHRTCGSWTSGSPSSSPAAPDDPGTATFDL